MKILIQNPTEPILHLILRTCLTNKKDQVIIWQNDNEQTLQNLCNKYKPNVLILYQNNTINKPNNFTLHYIKK